MSCCNEPGCRRRQPLRLYRGISGRWLIATRSSGDVATEKHALPEETQSQLSEMAEAHDWLSAVERATGGRQQILDALGLDMTRRSDTE